MTDQELHAEDEPTPALLDDEGSPMLRAVIGVVVLVVGIGYELVALGLPRGSLDRPGSGLFPLLAGGLAIIGGLMVVWESRGALAAYRARTDRSTPAVGWPWVAFSVAVLVAAVVMPSLGFPASAFVLALTVLKITARMGWIKAVLSAVAIAVITYWVFVHVLAVQLPPLPFLRF